MISKSCYIETESNPLVVRLKICPDEMCAGNLMRLNGLDCDRCVICDEELQERIIDCSSHCSILQAIKEIKVDVKELLRREDNGSH